MPEEFDVVVVGAGPAGLTAGIYLARAGLSALVLEKYSYGGQLATTDVMENYPGLLEPGSGLELAENMRRQCKRFGTTVRPGEVTGIEDVSEGKRKTVHLLDGDIECFAVVIASGASHRKLGVPGEDKFWGRGISVCATCDAMLYRGKHVAVVGGGNTAVKEAVFLAKFADKVTVVHRRDRLRAAKAEQQKLLALGDKVQIKWKNIVTEIMGTERVEGIRLKHVDTDDVQELPCDGVFMFVGFVPNTGFVKGYVELDERGYVKTGEEMAASVEGVFAAGDCRNTKVHQVVVAAGEGAVAALSAQHYVEELKGIAYDSSREK